MHSTFRALPMSAKAQLFMARESSTSDTMKYVNAFVNSGNVNNNFRVYVYAVDCELKTAFGKWSGAWALANVYARNLLCGN